MSHPQSIAQVVSLNGKAFAISKQGTSRPLKLGDDLFPGETVVTATRANIVLETDDRREIKLGSSESATLEQTENTENLPRADFAQIEQEHFRKLTQALKDGRSLDTLLDEEAPAAGQAQANSEGGHSFVQFERIQEAIGSPAGNYLYGTGDRSALVASEENLLVRNENTPSPVEPPPPVDTTPPNGGAAPRVVITEDSNNDGFINRSEAQGAADVRVEFNRDLVDIGDIVRVSDGSIQRDIVVDAQAKANGYVTTDFPLPAHGSVLHVDAYLIDPLGNASQRGDAAAKVDISDLNGLIVNITEDSNNDGYINQAELQGKVDVQFLLPAEAIAGDALTIWASGHPTMTIELTQADIDARQITLELDPPANGSRLEVRAQISDPAGNHSNEAHDSAILQTGAIGAPQVIILEDANHDGYINAAELHGNIDTRIDLPSAARAGDWLHISVNGQARPPVLLSTQDIQRGHLELNDITSPGQGQTLTVTAFVRDPAGNTSPTGSASAMIDISEFTGLAVSITEDRNNDGFINRAELRDNDIDVRVTLPAGAAVGDSLTVSGSGNVNQIFTLTQANLAAGYIDVKFNPTSDDTTFVATASIRDVAGNTAGPVEDSARLMLGEPGAPKVFILEDSNGDGYINAAELHGKIDTSITLPATVRAGDQLLITANGQTLAPIVLDQADVIRGSINLAFDSPGEGQTIEISAQIRDTAGNLGKPGQASAIIDTTPPNGGAAPGVVITEDTNGDGIISDKELMGDVDVRITFVSDKVNVGDIVTITSGTQSREITLSASDKQAGFVSAQFPPQAAGSTIVVEAEIRDPAGNTTPRGEAQALFWGGLIINDVTVSVSEEGLPYGIADRDGNPQDTTDASTASGNLGISSVSSSVSLCLLAPEQTLCSGGVKIVWSGAGTEDSPLLGRAGPLGPEVICASIDAQGNYQIKLLRPIDHADAQGENIETLNFTIRANDGSQQSEAKLIVQIEDDAPLAKDQIIHVGTGDGIDTNLMLMLDLSSSMRQCTGVKNLAGEELTRLDLAKIAINDLLDRYDALGDVKVRLVVFGNAGEALGDRWVSIDEARQLIASLEATGEASNYDAALATAQQAFGDDGRLSGGQNVSYFFSDGEPTTDNTGHPFNFAGQFDPFLGDGIDRDEACIWQDFLKANAMTSHAVGVGPHSIIIPNQLNPIAWDGQTNTELNAYWIGDFNEMACVFATTVNGPSSFNGTLGGFGADGGHVASLAIGGYLFNYDAQANTLAISGTSLTVSHYQFDPVARVLTIQTTAGETLQIGLCDGSYHYQAATVPPRGNTTQVEFTLVDNDGDQANGSLQFVGTGTPDSVNVAPVSGIESGNNLLGIIGLDALDLIDLGTRTRFTAFDANNNISTVEISYRSLVNLGPYHLQASHQLADELGLELTIVNHPGLLGLILPSSTLSIHAKDGGHIDNLALNELLGTVHYEQSLLDVSVLSATSITVTDSAGLSSTSTLGSLAEVGLLSTPKHNDHIVEGSAQNETLTATATDSRLYGYAGDDVLTGSDGKDLLRGGMGEDQLHGDAGNDLLIGGQGNDLLWGGAGSDVFRWEFGDQGRVDAPAQDRIMDFDLHSPVGAGGDIIDLRDLLQGEYHDAAAPGNLTQYLHFETSASGTTLHINPLGNGQAFTQQIIIEGVDFSENGQFANNSQIIQNLLQQGRLLVD
ncbi:retention module-containing protein [Azonexus sp.]|uniref:retention module-containing protein n=1 Tax=Azonexus sp. TaxID=1872668 RepID=UPI0039E2BCD8